MDNILHMGINGSFLIAAVICFRHFFFHQIPKRFFVFLWICAVIRLLFPFSIPVGGFAGSFDAAVRAYFRNEETAGRDLKEPDTSDGIYFSSQETVHADLKKPDTSGGMYFTNEETVRKDLKKPDASGGIYFWNQKSAGRDLKKLNVRQIQAAAEKFHLTEIFCALWLSVAVLLAAGIFAKHICSLGRYRMSLPLDDEKAEKWLRAHPGFPKSRLRRSEFVKSPLTYGVIRPVILLPSEISLNEEEFFCVAEHEWVHIRRQDVLVKYLSALTVCIYWFHPLVWIMAVLLNRDMELACDEEVIRKYSDSFKTAYARVLIRLAQDCRESLWPVKACFARYSEIEERIRTIMISKKYSKKAAVLAAGMICCIITAFTVSAQEVSDAAAVQSEDTQRNSADTGRNQSENTDAETQEEEKKETVKSEDTQRNSADSDRDQSENTDAENQEEEKIETQEEDKIKNQENEKIKTQDEERIETEKTGEKEEAAEKQKQEMQEEESSWHTDSADDSQAPGELAAELAKKYLGAPYKAGGTDLSEGTDSYGFVKAVYELAGIELPSDIQNLEDAGKEVSLDELSAGDIVVYCSADGSDRLFHAAIYDGSGQVIHASNIKEGVKISDLNYREISTLRTVQ